MPKSAKMSAETSPVKAPLPWAPQFCADTKMLLLANERAAGRCTEAGEIETSKRMFINEALTNSGGIVLNLVQGVLNDVLQECLSAVALPVATNEVLSAC
jgi:hypothetical protein